MNTVQEKWKEFVRNNIPDDTSPIVILNAQRIYYYGAAAILNLLTEISGEYSFEASEKIVEGLYTEVEMVVGEENEKI